MGYRLEEGTQLLYLGLAYHDLKQIEKAKLYFHQALIIFEEIGSYQVDWVREALTKLDAT